MVSRPSPGRAISEALCPDCAFPCGQAPGRRLRIPGATPPQPGGGLLERICPVEPLFIVPRRLAGGSRPAPPGRRRDGKAHSGRLGSRKSALWEYPLTEKRSLRDVGSRRPRLSVRRRARMRLSARPHARPSLAAHGSSQPGAGPQGRQGLGPVSCGLRKRREVRMMGPFPPYVRSQKWNWLLPSA